MTSARVLDAEIVVVGSGAAGSAAAIAAGRSGVSTLLVERLPFVGGTSTAVLDTFYAFYTAGDRPVQVVRGIGQQVVDDLVRHGACFTRPNSFGSGLGITYDPEVLKLVWDQQLAAAGVTVLTGAVLFEAEQEGERTRLDMAAKGGRLTVRARAVVDASGDADVTRLLGGELLADRSLVQPATMTFRLANVDIARAFPTSGRRPLKEYLSEGLERGYNLPGHSGSLHRTTLEGVAFAAMTRVPSPDPDNPASSRRADVLARRQAYECLRFLRDTVPGFERADLVTTSITLGIRETYRAHGQAVLTEADVLSAAVPSDAIALCGAPIEDLAPATTRWEHVPEPGYYGIPLGTLRPRGLRDLLLAGRCFSATHAAHSSARSMATCMALGHAAGMASVLAVQGDIAVQTVPVAVLQDALVADDALLAPVAPTPLRSST